MQRSRAVLVVFVIIALAAATLGLAVRLPSANPTGNPPGPSLVSYNQGIASKYHPPLSSMGMAAVNRVLGQLPRTGSVNRPAPTPDLASIPVNGFRFVNDASYMPQTETSVDVDPANINHVVGGVNDFRFFLCGPPLPASDCPSGFTKSVSGFTVSVDGGRTVLKGDAIPGMTKVVLNGTGVPFPEFLASFGDPSVAAGVTGNFYYASLSISLNSSANGIELAVSNAGLFNPTVDCTTPFAAPTTNNCWTTTFITGNLTDLAGSFEDKELISVDRDSTSPHYGDVYVSWDHFTATGTTESWVARCTPALVCTMLAGDSQPPLYATDPYPVFTTPAVGSDGAAHFTWCNYGTATTLGPLSCRVVSTAPNGGAFGPVHDVLSFYGAGTTLPGDTAIVGFATEQFRTDSIPVIAVDTSTSSNNLYFTIAACTSGSYYNFYGPFFPGNCGHSAILFSRSTDGGATWSTPATLSAPAVNDMPWVTTDPLNGAVVVAYYTTQYDAFDHRIDVVASVSTDQGQTFHRVRVTNVSNEPDSDPAMFDYLAPNGFGGSFIVPQYGDYLQARAFGGTIWALFTANYAVELGTFQTDSWLFLAPESSPLTVTSSSDLAVVDSGSPVTFTASTTNAAGPTTFAWTFGDGGTGTGATPTHSYTGTGRYNVVVTATDSLGRTATNTVEVVVSSVLAATASATPTATDVGQAVSFEATAAGGAGGYAYAWSFGDGTTSTVATPSHSYAAAGTYSVNAWVNDSGGGSVARTIAVIVNPVPTVSIQASVAATDIGVAVHFTSTVTAGTAPIRYAWDFKDASSSTAVAPAHEYARAGVFVVELIVTDAVKVTAATTVSVTVNALPAATAKASNSVPTVGESVGFTASVTDGTGPFTYAWVFGDGAVSSVQNPTHAYSASGTYPVHLWVNDSVGGSSLATIAVVASGTSVSTTSAAIYTGVAFLAGVIVAALVLIAIARRRKREEPPEARPPESEEDTNPPL